MKFRIGFYSYQFSVSLQKILLEEGHDLYVWFHENPDPKFDTSGLTKYSNYHVVKGEPKAAFENANVDFVFTDYNGIKTEHRDQLLSFKYRASPTEFTDRLEEDRKFGKTIAKQLGLYLPSNGKFFETKDTLITYLQSLTGKVVLKGFNTALLPPSLEEAIDVVQLDPYKMFSTNPKENGVFVESIVEGIECAFGAYYSYQNKGYLGNVYINREYKGACNNNRGSILTGEIGTTIRVESLNTTHYFIRHIFEQLAPMLHEAKYTGYIDLNTILKPVYDQQGDIKEYHPYFLEFTTRVGVPTTEYQLASYLGVKKKYGEFLAKLTGFYNQDPTIELQGLHCLSSCLFAYGSGLEVVEAIHSCQPLLRSKGVISHDNITAIGISTNADNRIVEWDRAAMVCYWGKIFTDTISVHHVNKLVNTCLDNLEAWGFTYREDVGLSPNEQLLDNALRKTTLCV